jgi:hypothetical protein
MVPHGQVRQGRGSQSLRDQKTGSRSLGNSVYEFDEQLSTPPEPTKVEIG